MPDTYRFTGHAGESLASGRHLVPFGEVPDADLTRDDENKLDAHDQALIDEGKLLPIGEPKTKPAGKAKETNQ